MIDSRETPTREQLVTIPAGDVSIQGAFEAPAGAPGVVVFAHGSGSGRLSPRNQYVARMLRDAGLGTLLIDLLTEEEEDAERYTAHLRFDIDLLAGRLVAATDWLRGRAAAATVGYFGASTGAAAALVAAAVDPRIGAVVSRGGRPDLADTALERVHAPTLLIVGGNDPVVLDLNRDALQRLAAPEKRLVVVPGATHLFEEPGTLERVAELAADWFTAHLRHRTAQPGAF